MVREIGRYIDLKLSLSRSVSFLDLVSGSDVGEERTWERWKYPFRQKHGFVPGSCSRGPESGVKGGVL